MIRRLLLGGCAGLLVLGASACGPQTDERVAPASTATAESLPSSEPVQSEIPPTSAYVTLDCATFDSAPADEPPAGATNVGDAWAVVPEGGVPSITLATDAQPATELASADITVGDGAEVKTGDTITFNYCGAGYVGQAVFDSSWARGEPATFPLPELVPGWQEGIPGMKVGGERLLVIPGDLGYGPAGTQGIAPNETIVFVIQLQSIG